HGAAGESSRGEWRDRRVPQHTRLSHLAGCSTLPSFEEISMSMLFAPGSTFFLSSDFAPLYLEGIRSGSALVPASGSPRRCVETLTVWSPGSAPGLDSVNFST